MRILIIDDDEDGLIQDILLTLPYNLKNIVEIVSTTKDFNKIKDIILSYDLILLDEDLSAGFTDGINGENIFRFLMEVGFYVNRIFGISSTPQDYIEESRRIDKFYDVQIRRNFIVKITSLIEEYGEKLNESDDLNKNGIDIN